MAASCPTGFDVTRLRNAVAATYDRVARDPETSFHFNMGADYAPLSAKRTRHVRTGRRPASPASVILTALEQSWKVKPSWTSVRAAEWTC